MSKIHTTSYKLQHTKITSHKSHVVSSLHSLFEVVKHFVTGQDLCDRAVRLAALADGGDEFAVLELNAIHRDIDF